MDKVKVFVSYSRQDEDLMALLRKHLDGVPNYEVFTDKDIAPGGDWYQEICKAIDAADVAFLLISAEFLKSKFIQHEEVPKLLQRRAPKGLKVIPVILEKCVWRTHPWLAEMDWRPKKEPVVFAGRRKRDIEGELAQIVDEVASTLMPPIEHCPQPPAKGQSRRAPRPRSASLRGETGGREASELEEGVDKQPSADTAVALGDEEWLLRTRNEARRRRLNVVARAASMELIAKLQGTMPQPQGMEGGLLDSYDPSGERHEKVH